MGGLLFDDPLHELLSAVPLGAISHGGATWGEILVARDQIESGDDDSWYTAWRNLADHIADQAAAAGDGLDASLAYRRAAAYYGIAYHPLYGAPVDPRLVDSFRRQTEALAGAVRTAPFDGEALEIPLGDATLPAYLFTSPQPRRSSAGPTPLIIATNGYDASLSELFLFLAVPAVERGYHCLIFDGPGQGGALIEQGLPMRSDWDTVVTAVVDHVVDRPELDGAPLVLTGWSLGGYLALRGASGEHRLAACIADPGLYGIREGMIARLRGMGLADDVLAGYPDLPADVLDAMQQFITADRVQHWTMEQRGFWVHGVDSMSGYLEATADFSLAGRLGDVSCPTLVAAAEADVLSSSAPQVVAELGDRATALTFRSSEGAGTHCEFGNRTLYDQRVFAWLDSVLSA